MCVTFRLFMLLGVVVTLAVSMSSHVDVCTGIRKDYKSSSCCGGNGDAFCAASDTFDFAGAATIRRLCKN